MTIKKLQNGSDIRGIAIDGVAGESVNLGENETIAIAFGFAQWLSNKVQKPYEELKISIGMDSRISGANIKSKFSHALSSLNISVLDAGLSSTPAMFMSTIFDEYLCDGAVMITASHLPFNRNGFKFFTNNGGLNKDNIKLILEYAEKFLTEKKSIDILEHSNTITTIDLIDRYSKHLREIIIDGCKMGSTPLKNLKIIVDAGNGSGGFFAEKVLLPLGANISGSLYLNPDGNFPNHEPNPENKIAMECIKNAVLNNDADLGIIFDTDVDRSGAVDEKGRGISRNEIVALAAALVSQDYPNGTVVTDSVTSSHLTEFIEKNLNMKHLRFQRGYKNVINKSIELNNQGVISPLAIETSGHAAFKDNFFLDDGAYLATKIVIKTALLKEEGKSIYKLIENLKTPAESIEIRLPIIHSDFSKYGDNIIAWLKAWVNAEDCIGEQINPDDITSLCEKCHCGTTLVEPNFEGVRINFNKNHGDGWALIRKSLHDPIMPINIESDSHQGCDIIRKKLRNFLSQFKGLDISKL